MSVRKRSIDQGGGWEIDIGVRGRRWRRTVQRSLSRRQAEALEKHWRVEIEAGRDPFAAVPPERPALATWDDLAVRWWEWRGRHRSDAATIQGHLDKLSAAIGADTSLEAIAAAAFEAAIEAWREEPRVYQFRDGRSKAGPPIGPETMNNRLRIARAIWRRARARWADECPPLADIAWQDLMLEEKDLDPLSQYLPQASRGAVLEEMRATAPHAYYASLIADETALRIGSVLSLDWSRIDFCQMVYTVRGKGRGGGRWLVKPLTPRLYDILVEIGPRDSGPVIVYRRPRKTDGGEDERPGVAVQSIRTAVRGARKRAAHPDFTVKRLRHTAAIEILASGGDLAAAQAVLDHQDPSTTFRHYGRLDIDHVREAMERRSAAMTARNSKKVS